MASSSSTPLTEANTAFSLALFKKISEDNKADNVFYSPLSISSALAMVLLGARGNTATQISEVLCFSKAQGPQQAALPQLTQCTQQALMQQQVLQQQKGGDDVNANFSKLLSELNKQGALYSLSLANRLYGEQNFQFVQEFLDETRKYYNAELQSVDFQHKAEEARVEINTWVEKQTQDKIKELLTPGVVDSMTILVLVNAIYFKGKWDEPFQEEATRDTPFKLNKNDTKTVKMMFQKAKFPLAFIPEANCQILEMPYEGKELSMLIFLPNDMEDSTTGLEKLEAQMTYEKFMEWTRPDKMMKKEVEVGLPRFKMTQTYDMNDLLVSMGMVDAFSSLSDFSGMSSANNLVLSKVVHKAFVEVNEEGTEAAAATAAVMMLLCYVIPTNFVADHPFLFFIRHNPSKSILFAGRYSSPEAEVPAQTVAAQTVGFSTSMGLTQQQYQPPSGAVLGTVEVTKHTPNTMASSSSTPLTEANTAFSLALFKKISEDNKAGNVFYSPLSISSALAMVLLGARGNTATQISEVLCFSKAEGPQQAALPQLMQCSQQMQQQVLQQQKGGDDVNANFSKLLSELNKQGALYSLSLANRLYGEQNFQFVQEFLDETRKYYNAELQSVDFQHKAEEARVEINTWVEKQTQDKIKELLKPGVVDSMTILVLVNAIYFKGKWDEPFQEEATRDTPFKLNKNDTKTVKMMFQTAQFPLAFIPEANCQILEMPYEGKELSMLIFLPNDMEDSTTGLEKLEAQMTYEKFMEWTRPDKMVKNEVKVGLPRFKMTQTYDMNDLLVSMGMVDAFSSLSDFSGMSSANNLVLSKVVHKAFVEVNEEGTEAAAATGIIAVTLCYMIPTNFVADHPFLFFIRHNPSKSILFAGRYSSPE